MTEFAFGQVEAVLAWQHQIADHKRAAFMSRLKHLQKNGLPIRDRPGRGRAGTFTFTQLLQIAIALEFVQSGIPPAEAAKLVTGNWRTFRNTAYTSAFTVEGLQATHWLWLVRPEALQELTRDGVTQYDHLEAVRLLPLDEAVEYFRGLNELPRGQGIRQLIINGSRLVRELAVLVVQTFKFATAEEIGADFDAEHDADTARIDVLDKLIAASPPISDEARERIAAALQRSADDFYMPTLHSDDAKRLAQERWSVLSEEARALLHALPKQDGIYIVDGGEQSAALELVAQDLMEVTNKHEDQIGLRLTTLGDAVLDFSSGQGG